MAELYCPCGHTHKLWGSSGGRKLGTNGYSSMMWLRARLTPSRWSTVRRVGSCLSVRILVRR